MTTTSETSPLQTRSLSGVEEILAGPEVAGVVNEKTSELEFLREAIAENMHIEDRMAIVRREVLDYVSRWKSKT